MHHIINYQDFKKAGSEMKICYKNRRDSWDPHNASAKEKKIPDFKLFKRGTIV